MLRCEGGGARGPRALVSASLRSVLYIYTVESVHMRFADIGRLNMAEISVLRCRKVRNWND